MSIVISQYGQSTYEIVDDSYIIEVGFCVMQSEQPTPEYFNIDGEWKLPAEFIQ